MIKLYTLRVQSDDCYTYLTEIIHLRCSTTLLVAASTASTKVTRLHWMLSLESGCKGREGGRGEGRGEDEEKEGEEG